jgi:hypothetical protein
LIDELIELAQVRRWGSLYWHTREDNLQARSLYNRYAPADGFVRYKLKIEC